MVKWLRPGTNRKFSGNSRSTKKLALSLTKSHLFCWPEHAFASCVLCTIRGERTDTVLMWLYFQQHFWRP